MTDFTDLINLASERLGAEALAASDDFFAPMENLVKASTPIFVEGKYTDRGKWMDGWESRRKRVPGHDWCLVKLGLPGVVRGVVVDTSFFRGNFPEQCSIEGCAVAGHPDVERLLDPSTQWEELLPKSQLCGDSRNLFEVRSPFAVTHLRLNIFPDGGVARLRVHGDVVPDWRRLAKRRGEIDLAAAENGGVALVASDMFFGDRHNLLMPGQAFNMGDGWETKRRRGPGNDWTIIRLGMSGTVERIEVDTSHFKGNYPDTCSIEACSAEGASLEELLHPERVWSEVLARTRLRAHTRHHFDAELADVGPVTHLRFNIFPDGGVARLRVFGTVSESGRERAWLRWLDTAGFDDVLAALSTCCGSTTWARRVAERRPFAHREQLFEVADDVWAGLEPSDWLEAFSAHPRIGERPAVASTRVWSEQEQSGARDADEETRAALADANRTYEAQFGYIFIVCATGLTAENMLAEARRRLGNSPEAELPVAAEEQRRITRLRLEKLLRS